MLGGLCLVASSAAAAPPLEVSGRLQIEAARIDGTLTDDGRARSARYLRRAELEFGAALAPTLEATVVLEFDSDGDAQLTEAVLNGWPAGQRRSGMTWRLGRFDPDFGLDPSTSSSGLPTLERSAIFDLAPDVASGDRSLGLRVDHAGRHHSGSAGLYAGESRDQLVARAVALGGGPSSGPARLWQLGASVALGRGLDDDGRLRSRLGLRAVSEADGGRRSTLARSLPGGERYRRDSAIAVEAAWQGGPWLVQAEWLQRRLGAASRGAAARSARGHTLQLARVLKGAPRRHDARRARFGRPASPAQIEAVLRLDRLRAQGGLPAEVWTLGLAWTPDDTWRLSANAVWARAADDNELGQTRGRGLALRLQASF
jgi:phosphate-selective porin OprO and OprP